MNWANAMAWLLKPIGKPPRDLYAFVARRVKVKPVRPKVRLPKGVRRDSLPKLKKELDRVFSIFIRQRDCHLDGGWGNCATCSTPIHIKESAQASHYQVRQDLATRWDETNVHAACGNCNGFRGGEPEKMAAYIDLKYGEGTAAALRAKAKQPFKLQRYWMDVKILYYKNQIKDFQ